MWVNLVIAAYLQVFAPAPLLTVFNFGDAESARISIITDKLIDNT